MTLDHPDDDLDNEELDGRRLAARVPRSAVARLFYRSETPRAFDEQVDDPVTGARLHSQPDNVEPELSPRELAARIPRSGRGPDDDIRQIINSIPR